MGLFSKIEDAKVSKRGQFFKPGNYRVEILAMKIVESQQNGTPYCVIETKVLESNNDEIKVGDEKSEVIDMTNVMGKSNVKAFIAAVSGVEPTSADANEQICKYWVKRLGQDVTLEQICELAVSDGNPLEGYKMELTCVEVPTKKDGVFTRHNWRPRDVSAEA